MPVETYSIIVDRNGDYMFTPAPDYRPPADAKKLTGRFRIRHVKQHGSASCGFDVGMGDCGLTCFAMLAGLSLAEAEAVDPRHRPLPRNACLSARLMADMLAKHTGRPWRIALRRRADVAIVPPPADAEQGAMIIKSEVGDWVFSHWVAFEVTSRGVSIFDPSAPTGPYAAKHYEGWLAGKFVVPAEPATSRRAPPAAGRFAEERKQRAKKRSKAK